MVNAMCIFCVKNFDKELSMTDLSNQTHLQVLLLDNAQRQRCEIWTRVMGYHRPVASFNTGKKGEFHERQYFREQPQNCGE